MPEWFSDVGPIRFKLAGDIGLATKHIPKARALALQLHNRVAEMGVEVNQYEELILEDAVIHVHKFNTQTIAVIVGMSESMQEEEKKKKDEPSKKPILWVGAAVRSESLVGQNTDAYNSPSDSYYYDADFKEHYQDYVGLRTDSRSLSITAGTGAISYGTNTYTIGTDHVIQYVPYINIIVCEPDWTLPDNTHTVMQSVAPIAVDYNREANLNKTGAALTHVLDWFNYTVTGSYTHGPDTVNSGPGFFTATVDSGVNFGLGTSAPYSDCSGNSFNGGYVGGGTPVPPMLYVDTNAYDAFASSGYNYWAEAIHVTPQTSSSTGGSWTIPVFSSKAPSGMYTLACVPHIASPEKIPAGVHILSAVSLIPDDKLKTFASLTNTFVISPIEVITNSWYYWPFVLDAISSGSTSTVSYSGSHGLSVGGTFTRYVLDPTYGCMPSGNEVRSLSYTTDTVTGYKQYEFSTSYMGLDPTPLETTYTHQSPGTIYPGEYKIYLQASTDYMINTVEYTVDIYIQLDEKKDPQKFTITMDSIDADMRARHFFYDTSAGGALPGTGDGWYGGHWVVDVEKETITHVLPP